MSHWKPTSAEAKAIRRFAGRECRISPTRLSLETGVRYNIDDASIEPSDNIALVSDHPDWDDTDLHDHNSWEQFRKHGVPLAEGGRAIVDFYCHSRGDWGQLESNIQAYVEGGKLVALAGTDLAKEPI